MTFTLKLILLARSNTEFPKPLNATIRVSTYKFYLRKTRDDSTTQDF